MRIPTLLSLRTNCNVLFWSLHAAGWAAYGITQYFGALLYEKPASYARVIAASAIAGFLLSMPMRYIYQRLWNRPPRTMILGVLATCYVTALALRFVINLSYKEFIEPDRQARTLFEFFGGALSTTYLLLRWSVLYFGIKFYESQRKQEEALLKAVALAQEAQLKMLRYQLNPHFLFNTLNAISTLILDNQNKKANYAVARLSEFLRYTLDQDPMKKVTLRQELDALDLYLGTERLRFAERLRLEYAVDEAAKNVPAPSRLLQPLLENSLKYASSAASRAAWCASRAARARAGWSWRSSTTAPGCARARRSANAVGWACATPASAWPCRTARTAASAVSNSNPGLRVDVALPLELAETAPEGPGPRAPTFLRKLARGAHA